MEDELGIPDKQSLVLGAVKQPPIALIVEKLKNCVQHLDSQALSQN